MDPRTVAPAIGVDGGSVEFMEPAPPGPQSADSHEVVLEAAQRSWPATAVVSLVIGAVLLAMILGGAPWPLLAVAVLAAAGILRTVGRSVRLGASWLPAQLVAPAGPLLLGSRTDLVYRRRPRHPRSLQPGVLHVALVCEERVVVGSGDNQSIRKAIVVRHLIEAPAVVASPGLEARFTIEVPMVAGGPTISIATGRRSVTWRIEASLVGNGLPAGPAVFPLVVAPVISPAWFDRPARP